MRGQTSLGQLAPIDEDSSYDDDGSSVDDYSMGEEQQTPESIERAMIERAIQESLRDEYMHGSPPLPPPPSPSPTPASSGEPGPSSGAGPSGEAKTCVICMDAAPDHLVKPCNHLCLCSRCAVRVRRDRIPCPVCRHAVRSIEKVYF